MAKIVLSPVGRPAPNAVAHSRVELGCLSWPPPLLGRRPRALVGRIQYAAAILPGASSFRADTRWRGERDLDEFFATELAARGMRGNRAIRDRKAKQDALERDLAFERFSREPLDHLANQLAAGGILNGIADTLWERGGRRSSLKQIRRRVGKLRKEFLLSWA